MKPFTVWLEAEHLEMLKEQAKRTKLPVHVLARSLLVRMLEAEVLDSSV